MIKMYETGDQYCLTLNHCLIFFVLQHKDDPLFAEFIEAHTSEKTAWIKNAFIEAAKSDDDDSGVEEEEEKAEVEVKETKKEDKVEKIEKVANKQISDIEVYYLIFLY